jgi:CRISPR/Cas system CMR subunit Cmr6 (Cas7 group RAMP superfamily)
MPSDTRSALGPNAEKCESRALLLERFCDPTAKEDVRKQVFTRAMSKSGISIKPPVWTHWLAQSAFMPLYAQLQSRLMVNMAGGVMENAGLCLDRFGLPYIPGSAVKGCARRAAIAALHEWCVTGDKPGGSDNPLAPCCEPFSTPEKMLAAIARVFGWAELDWADQPNQSDFAWACGNAWPALRETVVRQLAADLRLPLEADDRKPWKGLPNFGGSISFLPAYPVDLGTTGKVDGLPLEGPQLGKLELDVVTCHHREYYASDDPNAVATDTEEPVPVVFPAVAPGHVFAFALAPLRGGDAQSAEHARTWLKTGLETFGLGAKTNAGYGWFDCSEALQKAVGAIVELQIAELKKKQAEAEAQRKAQAEAEAKARAEQERLANAPSHERFKVEYSKLGDERFAAQAKKFAEMNPDQRHGFLLALKERRETVKRWAKKKPDLIRPWQEHAKTLNPPIELP